MGFLPFFGARELEPGNSMHMGINITSVATTRVVDNKKGLSRGTALSNPPLASSLPLSPYFSSTTRVFDPLGVYLGAQPSVILHQYLPLPDYHTSTAVHNNNKRRTLHHPTVTPR